MLDSYRRRIDYLRISVTDRCNLRCIYCVPASFISRPRKEILTLEEIERLCRIFVSLGVRKIRFTGGEPLIRTGFSSLLKRVGEIEELEELTLTTNGVFLEDFVDDLKEAGVKRINLSLDSLKEEKMEKITGSRVFHKIMNGLEKCLEREIDVKLNVVVMRGLNEDELGNFIDFSFRNSVRLRFIEVMPTRACGKENLYISEEEIINILKKFYSIGYIRRNGIENIYSVSCPPVIFGIIPSRTGGFCEDCNKVRVRSDGKLVLCIYSALHVDLKEMMRRGASDEEIKEKIKGAILFKPTRGAEVSKRVETRSMMEIGG